MSWPERCWRFQLSPRERHLNVELNGNGDTIFLPRFEAPFSDRANRFSIQTRMQSFVHSDVADRTVLQNDAR